MDYAVLKRHPFKPDTLWVLWKDLKISLTEYPMLGLLIAPKGFQTDLASIPAPWRWIWPPHGHYTEAAIMHDWLYAQQKYNKKIVDLSFLAILRLYGVPEWKCKMFYWAVKLFGSPKKSQREYRRRGGLLKIYPTGIPTLTEAV